MTDNVVEEIQAMEKRLKELKSVALAKKKKEVEHQESGKDDEGLLNKCLDVLQYATYHDGRYDQFKTERFQDSAQELVSQLAKRLGRVAYEGFGQ
jgi:hypothetical protein